MPSGVIRQLPSVPRDTVRAAGGILLRPARRRGLEVALVHRPTHGDWSLPKGKLERGESFEQCALREVLEETGYACALGEFAGTTEYRDRRGRPKIVAYWLMEPAAGASFEDPVTPDTDEVDELRWMALAVARRALTYRRDQELLAGLGARDLARLG